MLTVSFFNPYANFTVLYNICNSLNKFSVKVFESHNEILGKQMYIFVVEENKLSSVNCLNEVL